MSSNGQPASTGPKKKRVRKALEKRYKEPLPVYVNNESLTWVQYFVHALYTLIGYSPTTDRAFQGEYSSEASCICIRDKSDIQEIFCKGFFGKGNLSRSEPTWSQRVASEGNDSARFLENITEARRKQRRSERLTKQADNASPNLTSKLATQPGAVQSTTNHVVKEMCVNNIKALDEIEEHLQLSLVESFFLTYGLGCLRIVDSNKQPISLLNCWKLFCLNAIQDGSIDYEIAARNVPLIPDMHLPADLIKMDNTFIVNYVAYHYYRSKAWVIKDGIKFGVDYILYRRGPAFHHGEHAIVIIPSYPEGTIVKHSQKSWKWILGINRVCSQANKTLVLCYVNIPLPQMTSCLSPECLPHYSVTEVTMKRWIPEKTRG